MTYDQFEQTLWGVVYPKLCLTERKGQCLMNYLHEIWPEEYKRIASIHYYDETDIDPFYRDELVENCLDHLKKVWHNFPR